MSTYSYRAANRGKLVTVAAIDSIRVYSEPKAGATTQEFIEGPATVGTATGKTYTEGPYTWVEVLRALPGFLMGIPNITVIYLLADAVSLKANPAYDASKDTTAPNTDGSVKGTPDTSTRPDSEPTIAGDVSKTPGEGKLPVPAPDGEVVYVPAPKPSSSGGEIAIEDSSEGATTSDTTKKYLTWGLYGVLGLGVITLVTILVLSLNKPKKKP